MKNYSVSFDSMLIFKFKLPYGFLLGVSHWRLLPAQGPGGVGRRLVCLEEHGSHLCREPDTSPHCSLLSYLSCLWV